jgi:hypothetical protein
MSIIFTAEQLTTIAQYPKKAVDRAHARLKMMAEEGRSPQNPFTYFMGIVRNYKEGEGERQLHNREQATKNTTPLPIWNNTEDQDKIRNKHRREDIRNKAFEAGIPDIKYRSIADLQRILHGDELPPISDKTKRMLDYLHAMPMPDNPFEVLAKIHAGDFVTPSEKKDSPSIPVRQELFAYDPDLYDEVFDDMPS